jgi:hypothetical protein
MPKIRDLGIKVIPETLRPPEIGGGGGCSDCTTQQFSICGGTHGGGCTDCTTQQFSICGTTYVGCTDCTTQQFSICGGTGQQQAAQARQFCTDCTFRQFSLCGGTIGCTAPYSLCRFPTLGGCTDCTNIAFSICGTTARQPQTQISQEQISALKESLRQQIAALEEHEKTLGPKTADEIDARVKQLNDELATLKERRKSLK